MEMFNIFQGNSGHIMSGESYFGLEKDDVIKLAKLFLRGGGNAIIGGRRMYVKGEVFYIYKLNSNMGTDPDLISRFYRLRANAIYKGRLVQDIFSENATNVTKEILKELETSGESENVRSNLVNIELFSYLHPKILDVSKKLFEDGYYKESVQAASVEVINSVKKIYSEIKGANNLDGKPLMMPAFAEDNPVIRLVDEEVNDSKGIQEGYKFLFTGLV